MLNVMEAIPDIRMRPQKNNRTGKIELGADVQPVFDIAWYTFARLVADVAPPIYKDMNYFKSQGSILTWVACGEFFCLSFQQTALLSEAELPSRTE